MFSKTERLLYSVVGSTSTNALPFVCAVDTVYDLLFVRKIPCGNIRVTKDVYPVVAQQLGKSTAAVTRRISYFGNLCWDMAVRERLRHNGQSPARARCSYRAILPRMPWRTARMRPSAG